MHQSIIDERSAQTPLVDRNVNTADIGGTTMDIDTNFDAIPMRRATACYGRYEYFLPTLDARSVGMGDGSIIRRHMR